MTKRPTGIHIPRISPRLELVSSVPRVPPVVVIEEDVTVIPAIFPFILKAAPRLANY